MKSLSASLQPSAADASAAAADNIAKGGGRRNRRKANRAETENDIMAALAPRNSGENWRGWRNRNGGQCEGGVAATAESNGGSINVDGKLALAQKRRKCRYASLAWRRKSKNEIMAKRAYEEMAGKSGGGSIGRRENEIAYQIRRGAKKTKNAGTAAAALAYRRNIMKNRKLKVA